MNEPNVRVLVAFIRSVAVLATDAATQVAWLRSLDLPGEPAFADELALEFDDGFRLLPVFVARGWLNESCQPPLAELDALLTAMSGTANAELWHISALDSDRWEQVRAAARRAIVALGN